MPPLYRKGEKPMKTSGITRRIDHLGRIVVPKSMCKALQIEENDPLDITMEGDRIIIRKIWDGCIFCGKADRLMIYNGRKVCEVCIENLKSMT